MVDIATFIPAKQGGKLLLIDGYKYRKNGGNGSRIYFKFREGCSASATVSEGVIIGRNGNHRLDHLPDVINKTTEFPEQNEHSVSEQHGPGVNRSYMPNLTRQESYGRGSNFPNMDEFSEQNANELNKHNGSNYPESIEWGSEISDDKFDKKTNSIEKKEQENMKKKWLCILKKVTRKTNVLKKIIPIVSPY